MDKKQNWPISENMRQELTAGTHTLKVSPHILQSWKSHSYSSMYYDTILLFSQLQQIIYKLIVTFSMHVILMQQQHMD